MAKKYIEQETFVNFMIARGFYPALVARAIEACPAADVAEVVRCRDCKHLTVINCGGAYARCEQTGYVFWSFRTDTREHYCAFGERREG